MTIGKQHSHFISTCLKFWDNSPSIDLPTVTTLNAKKFNSKY